MEQLDGDYNLEPRGSAVSCTSSTLYYAYFKEVVFD